MSQYLSTGRLQAPVTITSDTSKSEESEHCQDTATSENGYICAPGEASLRLTGLTC